MFVNLPYSHVLVRVLQSDVSSCHEVFFLFCLKSIIVAVASLLEKNVIKVTVQSF